LWVKESRERSRPFIQLAYTHLSHFHAFETSTFPIYLPLLLVKCQSLKESIDKTFEDYNVAIEKANLELEATNRKYAAVLTDFPHQD
jgi:hypothetical protein